MYCEQLSDIQNWKDCLPNFFGVLQTFTVKHLVKKCLAQTLFLELIGWHLPLAITSHVLDGSAWLHCLQASVRPSPSPSSLKAGEETKDFSHLRHLKQAVWNGPYCVRSFSASNILPLHPGHMTSPSWAGKTTSRIADLDRKMFKGSF